MKKYSYLIVCAVLVALTHSCDSKSEKDKNTEKDKDASVQIDSSAFKAKKTDIKNFKVVEDAVLSTPDEVEKLVNSEDVAFLNEFQKFAQEFIGACATKNYSKASNYLAYTGTVKSRVGVDHFNYENAAEKNVVKTTVDVVFNFLAESKNYKFISSKAGKNKKGQNVEILEITFFKKGMGVNRRFFEILETPKGMLISNMR